MQRDAASPLDYAICMYRNSVDIDDQESVVVLWTLAY